MEYLDGMWFTKPGLPSCGLVKARDETTGEIKFYWGPAAGDDEELDARYIMNFGTKLPEERREMLVAWLRQATDDRFGVLVRPTSKFTDIEGATCRVW